MNVPVLLVTTNPAFERLCRRVLGLRFKTRTAAYGHEVPYVNHQHSSLVMLDVDGLPRGMTVQPVVNQLVQSGWRTVLAMAQTPRALQAVGLDR